MHITLKPLCGLEEGKKKKVGKMTLKPATVSLLSGMERCQLKILLQGKKRGFLFESRGKEKQERLLGRNLFGHNSHLFLEPDLEPFKSSTRRSKSLFTAPNRLSLNQTSKIPTEDNELRQFSAPK